MPYELAGALYVQALTEPAQRAALLHEATTLMDGLAPEVRNLHDTRQWRERIHKGATRQLSPRPSSG